MVAALLMTLALGAASPGELSGPATAGLSRERPSLYQALPDRARPCAFKLTDSADVDSDCFVVASADIPELVDRVSDRLFAGGWTARSVDAGQAMSFVRPSRALCDTAQIYPLGQEDVPLAGDDRVVVVLFLTAVSCDVSE
jgi:hypothetical protein